MDPQTRVGDADREQTIAALQQYTADGYLTLDEFSQRSAAAYGAATRGELEAVTRDLALPAEPPPSRRAAGEVASRVRWTPVAVVVAVLVGLGVIGVAVVAAMMIMMGGMGGMMP